MPASMLLLALVIAIPVVMFIVFRSDKSFKTLFTSSRSQSKNTDSSMTEELLSIVEDHRVQNPQSDAPKQPNRVSVKARKSQPPKKQSFQMPAIFATVDVETTGFSASTEEIIEIGALKYCCGNDETLEFSTLIRPTRPIPAMITTKTGITQKMVDRDGVSLNEGIQKLLAFLEDLPFVGYKVDFDAKFIKCAANQCKIDFTNQYLDVLDLARDAYPTFPNHTLGYVAQMLDLSLENTHRGLSDCRRTQAVFLHVVDKVRKRYKWHDPRDLPVVKPDQPRADASEHFLKYVGTSVIAGKGNKNGHLYQFGHTVVFTGDLLSITKEEAIDLAIDAGCNVDPLFTNRTTILISGVRDPSDFNGEEDSGKVKKAKKRMESGYPVKIITESQFLQMIKAN